LLGLFGGKQYRNREGREVRKSEWEDFLNNGIGVSLALVVSEVIEWCL